MLIHCFFLTHFKDRVFWSQETRKESISAGCLETNVWNTILTDCRQLAYVVIQMIRKPLQRCCLFRCASISWIQVVSQSVSKRCFSASASSGLLDLFFMLGSSEFNDGIEGRDNLSTFYQSLVSFEEFVRTCWVYKPGSPHIQPRCKWNVKPQLMQVALNFVFK